MDFIYTISLPLLVIISVAVAVALSLGGLALFHRVVNKDHLREGHDVAGFVYAVVGVIYAVLLAFVVIVVWEQFRNADDIAENEAMHIGNVRQLCESISRFRFEDYNRRSQ